MFYSPDTSSPFILTTAGVQPTEILTWRSPRSDPLFHTDVWDATAFNTVVSSPAESNPHYVSNEMVGSSCCSVPLSSPHKLENSVDPYFAEFAPDPGFVDRAARFSCFGSGSFNGSTGAYTGESSVIETGPRKRKGVSNRGKTTEPSEVIQCAANSSEDIEGEAEEKRNKMVTTPSEPPKDYIHVRARRGQATDSHSLAERVRREKISERMKLLQDLVPGCNKVTGKAVMLDEIINYVQSLQRQVEFLSMKLSFVNNTFPGDTPTDHHRPVSSGCGDDLLSLVQMGLGGPNSHQDTTTSLQHQRFKY